MVQNPYPTSDVPGEPTAAESAPTPELRLKEKEVALGDQVVTIKRLGTRGGLAVAQRLLVYIRQLREPFSEFSKGHDFSNLSTEEAMTIGLQILDVIGQVLEDEELLKVLALLLGQPIEVVGDAPVEDTMNAVADALSINDMPALMRAASRIWQEAVKMGERI